MRLPWLNLPEWVSLLKSPSASMDVAVGVRLGHELDERNAVA